MFLLIYESGSFRICEKLNKSDLQNNGKAFLHFRLKCEGTSEYSDVELYTKDELIDSCFVSGKWENVNADVECYLFGGEKCAVLEIKNEKNEYLSVADVRFFVERKNLFDGGILYQIAPKGVQMMGYVYVTKEKKVLVIDGGNAVDWQELTRVINLHGGVVHHWFITHYHNDHIGAVLEIFERKQIKTEKIYFDFPPAELLSDRGDNDNPLVEKWLHTLPSDAILITPKKGDCYEIDSVKVRVLNNAAFEKNIEYVNNTSIVYKLETGKTNVLFTGDLALKCNDYLCDEWFRKQLSDCTVVQMSHHGNNGVCRDFYEYTAVEICLYPTPLWLWNNDRGGGKNSSFWTTLHTREWMREKNVKKNYTAITDKTAVIY